MKKLLVSGMIASILSAPAFAMEHENEKDWSEEGKQEMQEAERNMEAGAQNIEEGIESAGAEANMGSEGNFADQPLSKEDAKKVQEKLADKGLYEGDIDGKIGPMTSTGIEKFQENNELSASGELNQETLEALGVDASLMQAQEEPQVQEEVQAQEETQERSIDRGSNANVGPNSDSSATRQGDYQYDDTVQEQEDLNREQELQEQEDINSRNQEHLRPKVNESNSVDESGLEAQESEY